MRLRTFALIVFALPVCAAPGGNNFVIPLPTDGNGAFQNPRAGWVFISYVKPDAVAPPELSLDSETTPLVWRRNPRSNAWEAMRFLAEGAHTIRNSESARGALDVRAVPEIAFCYYPFDYNVAAFGTPDLPFMDDYVLSDANTIVTRASAIENDPFFAQWNGEGRRWIANAHLPGLGAPTPPDAKTIADEWLQNAGAANSGYSGLIVDEFVPASGAHYQTWTDALRMVCAAPAMKDKTFYAWCVDIYRRDEQIAFCRTLKELGGAFVWEKYLREEPTIEIAERWIDQSIAQRLEEWQRTVPGIERGLIVCLGYMSAPPESLDVDPGVDYAVFLDMQFHALANDPRFFGLRGVMPYMSNYADEEYVRYAQQLIRHYCIEGKRGRMNDDPYVLTHVTNPDFALGLKGWTVDASEEGSTTTDAMDGFSFLQGRYPRYKEGDTFCRMRRGQSLPNRVSQTVLHLTPGRLYSLKMFSANIEHLNENSASELDVSIANAEVINRYSFDYVFASNYAHEVPPYNRDHPAYMTYHRRVFRATSGSAVVLLSDQDAPPGHVTAVNFVQVQPFHAP
ncbi:MAG: hypothetical protein HUU46_13090 [Candidatus Hydrogenedentes bacterium]|nr:hypothetical protein [Candidatus Hydrogenedentota bacterium]